MLTEQQFNFWTDIQQQWQAEARGIIRNGCIEPWPMPVDFETETELGGSRALTGRAGTGKLSRSGRK